MISQLFLIVKQDFLNLSSVASLCCLGQTFSDFNTTTMLNLLSVLLATWALWDLAEGADMTLSAPASPCQRIAYLGQGCLNIGLNVGQWRALLHTCWDRKQA